jgi:hypothetical protein
VSLFTDPGPGDDVLDFIVPGANYDAESLTVDVDVKAVLTMNIWIESLQMNDASTVLVTDSRNEDGAEILTGVDGVTGAPLEISIRRLG